MWQPFVALPLNPPELLDAGVDADSSFVPDTLHGFLNTPRKPAFTHAIARIATWLTDVDSRQPAS